MLAMSAVAIIALVLDVIIFPTRVSFWIAVVFVVEMERLALLKLDATLALVATSAMLVNSVYSVTRLRRVMMY